MKKLLLLVACCVPAQLSAQASTTLSTYVASDGGVSGDPLVVGLSLSRETAWLGVRAGGAIDTRLTPLTSRAAGAEPRSGVWSAELDGMLLPGGLADALPVRPYALVGAGVRGMANESGTPVTLTWSYGGGFRSRLLGPLHLEGEARYRQPLGSGGDPLYSEISAGMEYRFGLNLRFGGGARPARRRVVVPAVFPAAPAAPADASDADAAAARLRIARRALDTADDYLGVDYLWGGNTPESGFDCSGFVRYVFRLQGIELPRVSRDQARTGTPLPLDLGAFQPGDLLAFASNGSRVDHIAIYAGGGRIIHSSASGGGVRFDDLNTPRGQWYLDHMVAARRVIEAPGVWATR